MKIDKETRWLLKKLQSVGSISRNQAIKMWCGELLAKGVNRNVYELKFNRNWVVKIQISNNFDNVLEWEIYKAVQYCDSQEKWFAESLCITESGMVLVQRRATFPAKKEYPKLIPKFFTDMKYQNYGFINGQFVCVDYSNVLSMLFGLAPNGMRRAKWWTPYASNKQIKKARTKKYVIEAKL